MTREDPPSASATTQPVVDVHAHAFPRPLLNYLSGRGLADLSGIDAGRLFLEPVISGVAQGARIPLSVDQYDASHRLESMTAAGIDVQVVSAPPFVFGSMCDDPGLVLELARRSNDALAEYVRTEPFRLRALGTVPVGIPGAIDVALHCLDDLGMDGLTMGTYGGGRELDDPMNEDLWALVSERRTFCFLHPSRASAPDRLRSYYLMQLLGYPAETALAGARLIFGGVLDRHDPVLCLAHGGGCLPGLSPRLDLGWRRKREAQTVGRPPTSYLRRFLFDTAVFDSTSLARLIADMGSGNVLLGTDMPFELADVDAVASIRSLALPAAQSSDVLGGNARRFMPRLDALCQHPGRNGPTGDVPGSTGAT